MCWDLLVFLEINGETASWLLEKKKIYVEKHEIERDHLVNVCNYRVTVLYIWNQYNTVYQLYSDKWVKKIGPPPYILLMWQFPLYAGAVSEAFLRGARQGCFGLLWSLSLSLGGSWELPWGPSCCWSSPPEVSALQPLLSRHFCHSLIWNRELIF